MTTDRNSSEVESRALAGFAAYVDRLLAGETIDVEAVAANHPDFGDELIAQLRAFQQMNDASHAKTEVTKLGDYTLLTKLGSGGMGVVYEAWQNSLNRHVALKLLPKVSTDARAIARFIREAQVSAQLHHPNVVSIFDMGVERDTPYYTMELVAGVTLRQVLDEISGMQNDDTEGELGLRHCLDMATAFAGVADGLRHAHDQGVIHRDIKPANLMFDRGQRSEELLRGTLRILDFGLAQFDGQESLTVSGALVGTVRYMSPEQAAARSKHIDHRSDIYSFGATLYEAVTLQPPFVGDDLQETLSHIQFKDVPKPSQLNPRIPRDLETIVLKCMRKSPQDRFQTTEALAQDLRRFVRGDPIQARPQSQFEKLSRLAWKHRWSAASAALLLLATCFAIWFGSKWRTTETALRGTAYEPHIKEAISHIRRTERALYAQNPHELSIYPWGYVRFSPQDWESYDCFVKDCSTQSLEWALSRLDDAIASDPTRPDAYWHRARVRVLLNNWRAAQADLQDVMKRDQNHVAGLFLLASLERVHGDDGRSKRLFVRAQALAKSGWQRHWLRAQRAAQSFRWADAEEEFHAALNEAAGKEPYIGWDLEMRQGIQICMQLSEDYVDSLMKLEVLLDEWPSALDLQVSHGTLKYAIPAQRNSGLELLERLYRDNERDTAVAGEIAERVCLQHGLLVQTSKEPFNQELADKWVARIPDPRARAFVEYRMRRVHSVSDEPTMWNAHREEALEILRRASNDYPSNPWYLLAIAGHHWLDAEATPCVEEAAQRDPTCAYAQVCLAFRRAFHSFRDPADSDKRQSAEEALRQAQACNVSHTWERLYLAYAIGLLGDLEEATRQFDELSQQDHFPWVEHNRGEMLYYLAMAPGVPTEERKSLFQQSLHAQNIAIERYREPGFLAWKLKVLTQLQDDAETSRFYREVVADGVPLSLGFELHAGYACLNSGQHADAIHAFSGALQLLNVSTWLYTQLRDILRLSNAEDIRESAAELAETIESILSDRVQQQHQPHELLTLFDAYLIAGETENARLAATRLIRSCRNLDTRREPARSVLQQARAFVEPNLVTFGCIDDRLGNAGNDCDTRLRPFLELEDVIGDTKFARRVDYARTKCEGLSGEVSDAPERLRRMCETDNDPELAVGVAEYLRDEDLPAALAIITGALKRHPEHRRLQAAYWEMVNSAEFQSIQVSAAVSSQLARLASENWVVEGTAIADRLVSDGVIRINCAAEVDSDIDGELWLADRCFEGRDYVDADKTTPRLPVSVDRRAEVYSTIRSFWDPSQAAYRIPAGNGSFTVKLHFAETYEYYERVEGKRVFDIWIEERQVEPQFEIVQQVAFAEPLVLEYQCTVSDGVLDVAFVQHRSFPELLGMEVSAD